MVEEGAYSISLELYNWPMTKLTHLNAGGEANMVDVSGKASSQRIAVAEAEVCMNPSTLEEIFEGGNPKGDVLAVARIAGIQAAKRCADLIPLCHPLPLNKVAVAFAAAPPDRLKVTAECRVTGQTGVEMEALTAASIAALTIYDMCKAIDRGMQVQNLRLMRKEGGKSGVWVRGET